MANAGLEFAVDESALQHGKMAEVWPLTPSPRPHVRREAIAMDLQTMGGKPVTSENVPSIDNLRAHSPKIPNKNQQKHPTPRQLRRSMTLKPQNLGRPFVRVRQWSIPKP